MTFFIFYYLIGVLLAIIAPKPKDYTVLQNCEVILLSWVGFIFFMYKHLPRGPKKVESTEKILCAAIWYKELPYNVANPKNCSTGTVFCGYRHDTIINFKYVLTGLRNAESGPYVQGFLTSKNRFVSREEAAELAFASKQITQQTKYLYSEDLY